MENNDNAIDHELLENLKQISSYSYGIKLFQLENVFIQRQTAATAAISEGEEIKKAAIYMVKHFNEIIKKELNLF